MKFPIDAFFRCLQQMDDRRYWRSEQLDISSQMPVEAMQFLLDNKLVDLMDYSEYTARLSALKTVNARAIKNALFADKFLDGRHYRPRRPEHGGEYNEYHAHRQRRHERDIYLLPLLDARTETLCQRSIIGWLARRLKSPRELKEKRDALIARDAVYQEDLHSIDTFRDDEIHRFVVYGTKYAVKLNPAGGSLYHDLAIYGDAHSTTPMEEALRELPERKRRRQEDEHRHQEEYRLSLWEELPDGTKCPTCNGTGLIRAISSAIPETSCLVCGGLGCIRNDAGPTFDYPGGGTTKRLVAALKNISKIRQLGWTSSAIADFMHGGYESWQSYWDRNWEHLMEREVATVGMKEVPSSDYVQTDIDGPLSTYTNWGATELVPDETIDEGEKHRIRDEIRKRYARCAEEIPIMWKEFLGALGQYRSESLEIALHFILKDFHQRKQLPQDGLRSVYEGRLNELPLGKRPDSVQ